MRYMRIIVACGAILVVSGCSKSNPLLGKWKLAPNQGNECFQLGAIEFGDKTMTMATPERMRLPRAAGLFTPASCRPSRAGSD